MITALSSLGNGKRKTRRLRALFFCLFFPEAGWIPEGCCWTAWKKIKTTFFPPFFSPFYATTLHKTYIFLSKRLQRLFHTFPHVERHYSLQLTTKRAPCVSPFALRPDIKRTFSCQNDCNEYFIRFRMLNDPIPCNSPQNERHARRRAREPKRPTKSALHKHTSAASQKHLSVGLATAAPLYRQPS